MKVWLGMGLAVVLLSGCGTPPMKEKQKHEEREAVLTPLPESMANTQVKKSTGYIGHSNVSMKSRVRLASAADQTKKTRAVSNASGGALRGLLKTAHTQERQGDLAGAAATLERALRISPRSATTWARLANVRFHQRQYQRASSLAAKSNALAARNPALKRSNWLLIARAKKALGDMPGAEEAQRRAGLIN
jgi:tetratricopeptide (TPR) repeat protein